MLKSLTQIPVDFQRVIIKNPNKKTETELNELKNKKVVIKNNLFNLVEDRDKILFNPINNKLVIDIKREEASTISKKLSDNLEKLGYKVQIRKTLKLKKMDSN